MPYCGFILSRHGALPPGSRWLSIGLATGPLLFGGYYTHANPDYRGYEFEGYIIDASIAYRFGRFEAEAGGSWRSPSGSPADDASAALSASRGFRPRIGANLYLVGPFFLHLGIGYQCWSSKEEQPVTWNRAEVLSVISRVGTRFELGDCLEAFAIYEFSMEPLSGPRGTRAYSTRKDADGIETALGDTLVGFSNSDCLGIAYAL